MQLISHNLTHLHAAELAYGKFGIIGTFFVMNPNGILLSGLLG